MVTELTNGKFTEFIKEGTVLIDFYADWCMPCVMMGPIVEDVAEKFNVSSIPNFVLFKDGKMVTNFVGAMSEEDFGEKLKKFL